MWLEHFLKLWYNAIFRPFEKNWPASNWPFPLIITIYLMKAQWYIVERVKKLNMPFCKKNTKKVIESFISCYIICMHGPSKSRKILFYFMTKQNHYKGEFKNSRQIQIINGNGSFKHFLFDVSNTVHFMTTIFMQS